MMTPWTFVHVADIQVGSPRSFRFAPAWNENWQTARKQIIACRPDLLLVGGDLARDGCLHDYELEAIAADLGSLPFPVHAIPGNMDTGNKHTRRPGFSPKRDDIGLNVTSEQMRHYARFLGPWQWTFVHKNVRFSGYYEVLGGSDLPEEPAMWQFLEGLKDLPRAEHHVIITHYPLFCDRMDEPNWDIANREQYLNWYFGIDQPHRGRMMAAYKAAGVDFAVSGHIHCRKVDVVDGITFIKAPATCFSQWDDRWPDGDGALGFLRFDVGDGGIKHAFVPLERLSTAQGYGPGGHPRPEDRDYSIAWENPDGTPRKR